MQRLILVSTELEISPLLDLLTWERNEYGFLLRKSSEPIQILVGGIGIASTILELNAYCVPHNPHQVIQVGFAGSFDPNLYPGAIVEVNQDCFADLGFDQQGQFIPLSKEFPEAKGDFGILSYEAKTHLPSKRGITVQTTSGSKKRISEMTTLWMADIETMEGAAGMITCQRSSIPYCQVRAVSNFVEPRNKANWQAKLAAEELSLWVYNYLEPYL